MKKIYKNLLIFFLFIHATAAVPQEESFNVWLKSFKKHALKNGISENTFDQSRPCSLIDRFITARTVENILLIELEDIPLSNK